LQESQKGKSDVDIGPEKVCESGMSESDEENANLGAVPMLENILRELKEAQHVTKLIRSGG
jgi:hypothetical protein